MKRRKFLKLSFAGFFTALLAPFVGFVKAKTLPPKGYLKDPNALYLQPHVEKAMWKLSEAIDDDIYHSYAKGIDKRSLK